MDLYDNPQNQFVAGFIGSPSMNFLDGTLRADGAAAIIETASGAKLPLKAAPAASTGKAIVYGVRPEHFTIADDGVDAEVIVVEPTGSETQLVAKMAGHDIVAIFRERYDFQPGQKIKLKPRPDVVHLFDKETGKRI